MRSVAIAVRDDLAGIMEVVGGQNIRPISLVRVMNIKMNLASRLIRAIRAHKPLEILHAIPAPNGLRIFLEAAGKANVDPDLCQRAAASVDRFQWLIDEFPAGRAGLDAATSSSVPRMRSQAERTAKQSAFKAMSYILGHQADAVVGAVARQPSADGRTCDELHVLGKNGIRHSRRGRAFHTFGFASRDTDPSADDESALRTVDGEVEPSDLTKYLLRPFCSDPLPEFKSIVTGEYVGLAVPDDALDVNVPFTVVLAFVNSGAMRYRTNTRAEAPFIQTVRIASRLFLKDVFVHEDLHVGAAPEVSVRLPGVHDETIRLPHGARDLEELDLSVSVESLGIGLGNIDCTDVPAHAEIIEYAFKKVGWDPNRFHVYRYQVIYPIPLVSFTWWFPLAEPPQSGSNPRT